MGPFGFYRLAVVSPRVAIANPQQNAEEMCQLIEQLHTHHVDLIVFPELSLTGYTCGDLFLNRRLIDQATAGLETVCQVTRHCGAVVVVGTPWVIGDGLFNTAAIIQSGKLKGLIPKRYLPNYREFYEQRWFRSAENLTRDTVDYQNQLIPCGTNILFSHGSATLGIEVCEDLWVPIPPSSQHALAGANILVNLSASNAVIGKSSWRRTLVAAQSGRCIAAYAYAGAGPTESTTDLVFGGDCLVAENGEILAAANHLHSNNQQFTPDRPWLIADIDLDRLRHDRLTQQSTFLPPSATVIPADASSKAGCGLGYREYSLDVQPSGDGTAKIFRSISGQPFVPADNRERDERCQEIFAIQTAALGKRISRIPDSIPLVIGVSGGLDSTLALLAAVRVCDQYSIDRQRILGITMPGFGTSSRTYKNAIQLIASLGIQKQEIDIRPLCWETFKSLDHRPLGIDIRNLQLSEFLEQIDNAPMQEDLTFENVQARVRTLILMSRGFVLGTGDLSEQALGWSTYNGDHMSMYNVNTSVPKTLVRFLVRYAADHFFTGELRDTLNGVADTPISPELLPLSNQGEIRQSTEGVLGAYELHDFFLYHFVRWGAPREKIHFLAQRAHFSRPYSTAEIEQGLDVFLRRFFQNQFKRSCVPDGPKLGSVSLSPRGDWRMPSDADVKSFQ
jgi:NAD+ synthase (glutamine-hydrolysing)